MVWVAVLLADFLLDFRFEFLWPLWCLLRSVYDSYRYQGLVSFRSLSKGGVCSMLGLPSAPHAQLYPVICFERTHTKVSLL